MIGKVFVLFRNFFSQFRDHYLLFIVSQNKKYMKTGVLLVNLGTLTSRQDTPCINI